MRALVSKTFTFEAAHHLPNHDGKCREPHGHSYRVVVTCEGTICEDSHDNKHGMVIDFAHIKSFWKRELEPLMDHQDLNVTLVDSGMIPVSTAECIAYFICRQYWHARYPVKQVEVWETATSTAKVMASEAWSNDR